MNIILTIDVSHWIGHVGSIVHWQYVHHCIDHAFTLTVNVSFMPIGTLPVNVTLDWLCNIVLIKQEVTLTVNITLE